jgi:glycosyltransferase involved in cell wall biosynthesis
VFVVDDGSSDRSVDVIALYASELRFIRFSHTGWPGYVRSQSLKVATGAPIAFLDADDTWERRNVSKILAILRLQRRALLAAAPPQHDHNG